ncbi:family 78 glycoside hydrolase catalytic domain [Ruania zhangjianzhongii]|uniref:family 78 glycoside hydrolase catalytic domain n=1 Tax=Ruania zhangjianzhongii TaxID=2603206 RepID=UPI0011C974AB|nr:family 78 glycoside hydrolase catalytic domain [Ruania zhangjianzhongii]
MNPIDAGASWITSAAQHANRRALPVLAAVIDVPDGLARATLHVAALGVLQVRLDGAEVTDDVLEPGYADWRRSGEYTGWELALTPGRHVLRFDLGGGMYRSFAEDDRWIKVHQDIGDIAVAAVLDLELADGTIRRICTDQTWAGTTGATTTSNWVGGEDYDASLEPDATIGGLATWPCAVDARVPPDLRLEPKQTLPIRVQETLAPRTLTRHGQQWIVDFGQNVAGWPELDLPPGSSVRLRPAELLQADGGADVRTQGWGPVRHEVDAGAAGCRWHPAFMYNGLRYLEVTGLDALHADQVRLHVLAADAPASSAFTSSDQRLNDIWALTRAAIRSNMMSVFTDCPQREKLGYLEQIHSLHDLLVRSYDCGPILDRMLRLAVDAQREDGSIGLYAPEWEDPGDPWRGDPNWGGTVVLLPLARYRHTGQLAGLELAYPAMLRYIDFLLADRDSDGILRYGLGDFNGASTKKFRSMPLVSTATLVKLLQRTAEVAALLGRPEEARLQADAAAVAADFHRALVAPDGRIGTGTVAEWVVALDAGLAPEGAIEEIDRLIRAAPGMPDVGAVVLTLLASQLARAGKHETLLAITRVTAAPSYGYMLAHGATALTETWDGPTFGFSQNHFMNGAIATWFHEHVLGIRQREGTVGWTDPLIAPTPVGDLTSAAGHFDTPTGRVQISWQRSDDHFTIEGQAPQALVRLPSGAEHHISGRFRLAEEH